MLDPREWLDQAQALTEGKTTRVGHHCGEGNVLVVRHTQDGWGSWCHRCHDKGWVPKPLPTLAERMARKQAQQAAERAIEVDPRPPMPANFDVDSWPLPARCWLYKAGLFKDDIAKLGAYYHERTNRVVLPVLKDGAVAYWQARRIGDTGPKYLNPLVDKRALVAQYGAGDAVVLTEDILSAFRVGQVGEGWSLLGTTLTMPVLARLLKDGRPVLVWLDNDVRPGKPNPGQVAAGGVMRTLTNVGIPCHNIVSDRDPKLHSRAEIQEVLCQSILLLSGSAS